MTITSLPARHRFRRPARALFGAATAAGVLLAGVVTASAAPATNGFNPYPTRLLDTRSGVGAAPPGPVSGLIQVPLPESVPDGDTALLSVTAVGATHAGNVTIYPNGADLPRTTSLSFDTHGNTTASVLVPPGANGVVDLNINVVGGATNLVVDLIGELPASTYQPSATAGRVFDTRLVAPAGPRTGWVTVPLPPEVPANAAAAAVSITQFDAVGAGNISAYPAASVAASASEVSYVRGSGQTALAIVHPTSRTIALRVGGSATNFIVNYFGFAPQGSSLAALSPSRVADTRSALNVAKGPVHGTVSVSLPITVPTQADYAVLNLAAVNPTGAGTVSAFSAASGQPTVSLNYSAGRIWSGSVLVRVSNRTATFTVIGAPTQLAIDLEGYVANVGG